MGMIRCPRLMIDLGHIIQQMAGGSGRQAQPLPMLNVICSDLHITCNYFFPRILKPSHLKITLSAHTPGMHHALGNLLPVELAQLLKEVVVLKQYRTCTGT